MINFQKGMEPVQADKKTRVAIATLNVTAYKLVVNSQIKFNLALTQSLNIV